MDDDASTNRAEAARHLFNDLVELAPEERADRLEALGDAALRRTVTALLDAHERPDDPIAVVDRLHATTARSALDAGREALVGRQIRHYQITDLLGQGGMGVVYQARDTKLGRSVALKFLPPHLAVRPAAKQRFVREAKAGSALDHPNIATVYEIGETDTIGPIQEGRLFIAMACYHGETLEEKIARGPLAVEEVLGYAVQIVEGLAKAHAEGIVHRDVKPGNVMVTGDGYVKLLDFGIAKLGDVVAGAPAGPAMGTVAYMSPEQARGETVDHRSDLWSLGVVLYEMLTGERPFEGEHSPDVLTAIRGETPRPIQEMRAKVPNALAEIVETLLRKDPGERPPGADELWDDLQSLREELQFSADTRLGTTQGGGRRPGGGIAGLAVVLALIGALFWQPWAGSSDFRTEESVVNSEGTVSPASVAVLPLENLSGDPGHQYVADGMTDAVIAELGQIRDLAVISRTPAMQDKDSNTPLPQVAEELGADYLVNGAVLPAEDSVRITVRLVGTAADTTLWTKSFVRPMRNVLGLQRTLARTIVGSMEVELSPAMKSRLAEAPEIDPEAYRHYRRGVELRDKQLSWERARGHFERAVAIDPNFALAWAWLAKMHTMRPNWSTGKNAAANAALQQALRLDPDLSEAHVARAKISESADRNGPAAEAAYRRAVALNPSNREARYEYGWLLIRLGRTEEAVAEMKRVLALDPRSVLAHHGLIWAYCFDRQYRKGIEQAQRAFDIEPGHPLIAAPLGECHRAAGQHEEAEAAYRQKYKEHPGDNYKASFHAILLLAERGQRESVMAIVEAKWARAGSRIHNPTTRQERAQTAGDFIRLARTYATLGDIEPAIDALENAYDTWPRHHWFTYLKVHPDYDPLRGEARFHRLVEKVELDG